MPEILQNCQIFDYQGTEGKNFFKENPKFLFTH